MDEDALQARCQSLRLLNELQDAIALTPSELQPDHQGWVSDPGSWVSWRYCAAEARWRDVLSSSSLSKEAVTKARLTVARHIDAVATSLAALRQEAPAETFQLVGPRLVSATMASTLPLVMSALPRDSTGAAVMPHPHKLSRHQAAVPIGVNFVSGEPLYYTNKVCDQCNQSIHERTYFSCQPCDVDFCNPCHQELETLFATKDIKHAVWAVDTASRMCKLAWDVDPTARQRFVQHLARDWPLMEFANLVEALVDVANSLVVHVADSSNIAGEPRFWWVMAMLQLLYVANSLDAGIPLLDEEGVRGPRVPLERFVIKGVDKCEAHAEYRRWKEHTGADAAEVVHAEQLELTPFLCSFLAHTQLVSVSFRRECLLAENKESLRERGRRYSKFSVRREPKSLREDLLKALENMELSMHFLPRFEDEPASGAGVRIEFFQLALQAFLALPIFRYDDQHRYYWFADISVEELVQGERKAEECYRACGALLAQGILCDVLVPRLFPLCLYMLLLHRLGSVKYQELSKLLGLGELATVAPEIARSLEHMLKYTNDDIDDVFGSLEFPERPDGPVTHANKRELVRLYVEWFFTKRFEKQFDALCGGFSAVVGSSTLLTRLFDASQLEAVVCGEEQSVDIPSLQRGAVTEGWSAADDEQYLRDFWACLAALNETDRRRFLVFVTASDRMPLKGWSSLSLRVRKNGTGDERLPTAFTCFNTLLLPRYSSLEHLKRGLEWAVLNSQGFGLE
eukprot:TRINITY_DN37477_c0_g1_i1.p1 TRINITY_DN37477_c0_g1~~TRINITY_DN37477_c0_g1_i1.p1  ORF type:complete len:830 (-),score=175.94 TRINITY_DN37477_c0_g1_i1:88-2310(-)